ncbi:MAG: hypothetical protein ABIK62_01805, partial [candidate division WOR-3 bacterium]
DSAHNPDSIQALVACLRDISAPQVTFVVGFLRDKPARQLLRMLKPCALRFILVEPDSPRAMPIQRLARIARELNLSYETTTRPDQLIRTSRDNIVVTGSFYLAAQALRVASATCQFPDESRAWTLARRVVGSRQRRRRHMTFR